MSNEADDSLDLLIRIKADTEGATVSTESLKDVKAEVKDGLDPALAHFGETQDQVSKSTERMHINHRELHMLLRQLGPQFSEVGQLAMFGFAGPAVAGLAAVALAAGKVMGDWEKMQEAINSAVDLSGIAKLTEALGQDGLHKALIEGGEAADEFWEKINRLATAQESLKDKTDDATESIKKQHEADTQVASAREKAELAAVRVAEVAGRISKEEAARQKAEIQDRYAGQEANRKAIDQDQTITAKKHEREVDQRIVSEGPDVVRPKRIAADEAKGRLKGQKAELEEWQKKLADIEKWFQEKGANALGSAQGRGVYAEQEKARTLAMREIANREQRTIPEAQGAAKQTADALADAQRKTEEAQKRIIELNREIAKLEADRERDKATRVAEALFKKFERLSNTPIGAIAIEDAAKAEETGRNIEQRKPVRKEDAEQLKEVGTAIAGHNVSLLRAELMTEAEPGAVGPLNDCGMIFLVTDATAAVEIVKEELEQLRLLNHCQIGIWDDGGNWQAVYPHSDTPMLWLMSMERQELWAGQYNKKMLALAQFLRDEALKLDNAVEGDKQ